MDLIKDRDKGQAFVYMVMNLQVSYNAYQRLALLFNDERKCDQRVAEEASQKQGVLFVRAIKHM